MPVAGEIGGQSDSEKARAIEASDDKTIDSNTSQDNFPGKFTTESEKESDNKNSDPIYQNDIEYDEYILRGKNKSISDNNPDDDDDSDSDSDRSDKNTGTGEQDPRRRRKFFSERDTICDLRSSLSHNSKQNYNSHNSGEISPNFYPASPTSKSPHNRNRSPSNERYNSNSSIKAQSISQSRLFSTSNNSSDQSTPYNQNSQVQQTTLGLHGQVHGEGEICTGNQEFHHAPQFDALDDLPPTQHSHSTMRSYQSILPLDVSSQPHAPGHSHSHGSGSAHAGVQQNFNRNMSQHSLISRPFTSKERSSGARSPPHRSSRGIHNVTGPYNHPQQQRPLISQNRLCSTMTSVNNNQRMNNNQQNKHNVNSSANINLESRLPFSSSSLSYTTQSGIIVNGQSNQNNRSFSTLPQQSRIISSSNLVRNQSFAQSNNNNSQRRPTRLHIRANSNVMPRNTSDNNINRYRNQRNIVDVDLTTNDFSQHIQKQHM